MSNQVNAAREMMLMLHKEFATKNHLGEPFPLNTDGIEYLSKAAAILLEATAKFVPDADAATAAVRISNLEAMNDNLRVNNAALREVTQRVRALLTPLRAAIVVAEEEISGETTCGYTACAEALSAVEAIDSALSVATPEPSK